METITLKVPPETARWLKERAKRLKRSKSEILREALDTLRQGERRGSALDAAGELSGSVSSFRKDLSTNKARLRGFGR